MQHGAANLLLKIIRIVIGVALMLSATAFLIQGGFSRYARFGVPPHADWRLIAIGLCMMAVGAFLFRPFWWRHLPRR
jgi:hypothetical protein